MKKVKSWFCLLIAVFTLPLKLMAGGLFLYEISTADMRLASAGWSARAEDPSTLFTNPAGMTRLCGRQVELGLQPIYGHLTFDPNSETTVVGSKGHSNLWLPAGSFFLVTPYNDCLTFGIGSLGYFGSDLVYNHDWVGRYFVQKTMCEGLSLIPAVAYRLNCKWSFGAGVNIMYGMFRQRSAIRNALDNLSDGFFTMRDYKFGVGGVFGILYEYSDCTRFGVQYLTPVKLNFRSRPHFHNIGPILTDILTRTGIIESNVHVDVRVPQGVIFSVYHDLNCSWSVMANAGWQQWSRFEKVSINLNNEAQTTLSSKNKYLDTWHGALGVEYHFCNDWTASVGVAYDSSAVSNAQRKLDFPVGKQWRLGGGARWAPCSNLVFDLSSVLEWQGSLKADLQGGPLTGRVAGNFRNSYIFYTSLNMIYAF